MQEAHAGRGRPHLASRLFGLLVRARGRAYAAGWLGTARLGAPVVSVGNLGTGGAGKTPTVIALGRALRAQGVALAVLSRGYGRARRHALAVAETGREDAALVGDEPKLIAQRLGVPVVLHRDRFRAGLEAERRYHPQLHLLDDGFQHRALARDFDLVLLNRRDLDGQLLPHGRLREPLSALARAHAVLWVDAGAPPDLSPYTSAPVFAARKRALPVGPLPGRPFAFCGLARPESFWDSLREAGIEAAGRRAFRDHHAYSARDLRQLEAAARACGATGFVTTAKDAVKLPALDGLRVLEIEMDIPEIAKLIGLVRAACRV